VIFFSAYSLPASVTFLSFNIHNVPAAIGLFLESFESSSQTNLSGHFSPIQAERALSATMAERRHRPSLSDGPSPISPPSNARTQTRQPPPEGLVPPTYQYQDFMSAPSPDELAYATLTETRGEQQTQRGGRQSGGLGLAMQSPPLPVAGSQMRGTPPTGFSNSPRTPGSVGVQFTPPSGFTGTPNMSNLPYDPVGAYAQVDDELPNRYDRRSQTSMGGLEPLHSSTERLTGKKMATTSIRSTQSKRSKYDSRQTGIFYVTEY
jgi:hypothetical protein